jgi:hypothetical protein
MNARETKYGHGGAAPDTIFANKANSISARSPAKPLFMSDRLIAKSFVLIKTTAHHERSYAGCQPASKVQPPTPAKARDAHGHGAENTISANEANSISALTLPKPLIGAVNLELSLLFPSNRPLRMERLGFERHRLRYRSRPKGIPPPTSKIQRPTSTLDRGLRSYVIVVSIQYEASIRSFFLRYERKVSR